MKSIYFVLLSLSLLGSRALAESTKAAVYEFVHSSTGKKQIYLYAYSAQEAAVQIFRCGAGNTSSVPTITGELNLDLLAQKYCTPLFDASKNSGGRMMSAVKTGKQLSLHLGGTDTPESMSIMGNPKSWVAVFNLDTEDSKYILFTGVGIEAGPGTPRTDSVRATLRRVAEGALEGKYPLLPVQKP